MRPSIEYREYQDAAHAWVRSIVADALNQAVEVIKARPRGNRRAKPEQRLFLAHPERVSGPSLTKVILQALSWHWCSFSALRAHAESVRPGTSANTLSTTLARLVREGRVEPRDVGNVREYRTVSK